MKTDVIYLSLRKKQLAIIGILLLATIGTMVTILSPSLGVFSKFTPNTLITAQNISSNWIGDSDNTYRSTLPSYYISKLDLLTLAILKKGSSMTDVQFKSYLENLSRGISTLASKPNYSSDKDIINILGFLIYEIESAKTVLGKNINAGEAFSDLANIINTTNPSNIGTQSEQPTSNNSNVQQTSTQSSNTINPTPVPTPVAVQPAPTPVVVQTLAEKPNSSTKIHGINFKVEGYDLAKSNFEYNFTANTLKSKSLGVTFDFSESITEPLTFDTILAAEDYCKSKGRGYRIPKTYELKSLYALNESIDSMYYGGNGDVKGFYRVTQTDVNYNIGIRTHYVADFIPLDILSQISKAEYINGTIAVLDPASGNTRESNYSNMKTLIKRQYLAKGDDGIYYLSRPDGTWPISSYQQNASPTAPITASVMALCVYE